MGSYWDRWAHLREKQKPVTRTVITTKGGVTFITENGVTRRVESKKDVSVKETSLPTTRTIGFKQHNQRVLKKTYDDDDDDFISGDVNSFGGYGGSSYYDYYNSRHNPIKQKKRKSKNKVNNNFGFSHDIWRNYSYATWSFNEDDDNELLCKDPINYITPCASDIKHSLPCYSKDKIHLVKDLCRFFYFQMIDDKEYLAEKWKNAGELSEEKTKKLNILIKLQGNYVPGFTPFDKAKIVYYRIIDEEARSKSNDKLGGGDCFEFDRDVFEDNMIKSHLDIHHFTRIHKLRILEKISLVKHFGKEFVISANSGEVRVANSINKKSIRLKEYEDIFYVDLYQKVLPNFKNKFITKDLNVSVPMEIEKKKQKVIILLDESGSMDQQEKQIWVTAILSERFKHIEKEDVEIYFSYFVYAPNILKFHCIKTQEDVENFWRTVYNANPNGGGTDMGRIVASVKNMIPSKRFFNLNEDLSVETPEILIINDGQDSANTAGFGHKVNAISLMCFSSQLKNLCLNSGGRQIEVKEDGKILSYSKDNQNNEVINKIVT